MTCSLLLLTVYATDYMELITNKDQRKLVDEFASDLEMSLRVRRKSVSFNSL